MRPVKTRQALAVVAGVTALLAAGWLWTRPVVPADTPYFQWRPAAGDGYELVVDRAAGNPEFRQGVETTPVPRSGSLRVRGNPGAADPGATVEVSNPRTGRGYRATADAAGAFTVEVEARRGDTLKVISRRIRFSPVRPPAAGAVVVP
jgi:hypothetical protein